MSHIWFLLWEFVRAPIDAVMGRSRRGYTLSTDVDAPRNVTWAVASAHSVRLEGSPPIEIITAADPARPGVYTGRLRIGDLDLPMAYRVLDERPGEAMAIEVLKGESAPECCPGDDYICAFAVTGDDKSSSITSTYEVTHTRFASRLLVPLAAVQNIRRLRANAQLRAGRTSDTGQDAVKNALLTGALTFASFFALFGLSAAAMLIVLILIHELGHVLAMRWAGIPVKGLYFVPFFGGVAVSADRYRSEAERGLVALMGPGFSLATTALFMYLAMQGNDPFMIELAFMSALLNGFNLLPIMPLDGGHVAQAMLSRFGANAARIFNAVALVAGAAIAMATRSYLLLLVLLLVAPSIGAERGSKTQQLPALTGVQWLLLAIAYAAALIFYADAILQLADASSQAQRAA
ncbi:MAG TPA: site-2 protease family protein [Hyphomicrobium sp.]|nr:site-2 protease family protein [Hyphomicrobium sp.]